MNIEKLKKIMTYHKKNEEEIKRMIRHFSTENQLDSENHLLDFIPLVRAALQSKNYLLFEIPFEDKEIGAICYKREGYGYVVVNTSLPQINVRFALAHEIYHVYFQKNEFASRVEFSGYEYDDEEEYAANLFAGGILMPEISFKRMFHNLLSEAEGDILNCLIRLMSCYKVPYMAVLIRTIQLGLIPKTADVNRLLSLKKEEIYQRMDALWLDKGILAASNKDDYERIKKMIMEKGQEHISDKLIKEDTLFKILKNMDEFYKDIKGV